MVKSWQHKGLKRFFEEGVTVGVRFDHQRKLKIILQRLNAAIRPQDMNTPEMKFHKLMGNLQNYFSVTVNKNWRVYFHL